MKKKTAATGFCGDLFAADAPEAAAPLPEAAAAGSEAAPPSEAESARLAPLFARLALSAFRSRFRLSPADAAYVAAKGMAAVRRHAADFVRQRLAPAAPPRDGRQTPMRGHPVFLAQHATGCCCRSCLAKWHGIPAGRPLTPQEQRYVVAVVMAWISRQMAARQPGGGNGAR